MVQEVSRFSSLYGKARKSLYAQEVLSLEDERKHTKYFEQTNPGY